MSTIKVLVVDDQRLIREGIASLISIQDGIEVVGTADNGKTAIELAVKQLPDIVLMDIRMPVMDGILATQEIRRKHLQCQVIMLTTFDDDEYIFKSLKAGAVGYLLKDIPPEDLAGAIRMAHQGIYQLSRTVTGRLIGKLEQGKETVAKQSHEVELLLGKLSEREKDVLKQMSDGLSNKEIADVLCISEGTVKNHVSHILITLNFRDRVQAALFVIKNKIF